MAKAKQKEKEIEETVVTEENGGPTAIAKLEVSFHIFRLYLLLGTCREPRLTCLFSLHLISERFKGKWN